MIATIISSGVYEPCMKCRKIMKDDQEIFISVNDGVLVQHFNSDDCKRKITKRKVK